MHKLNISPRALEDLPEIKGYVSKELCSPQAADHLAFKIVKKIRMLSIYVTRVLYGGRDYTHILFNGLSADDEG